MNVFHTVWLFRGNIALTDDLEFLKLLEPGKLRWIIIKYFGLYVCLPDILY